LTGGKSITVYAQHEVIKDLVAARVAAGAKLLFEAEAFSVHDLEGQPAIRFQHGGEAETLECDFIAGCDGFHGICRPAVPAGVLRIHEHVYPFAWLGILAKVAPASEELIYTYHDRGFSLLSMRSPEISRLYLQCKPEEDLAEWSDDRIWEELHTRLATRDGPFHKRPRRTTISEKRTWRIGLVLRLIRHLLRASRCEDDAEGETSPGEEAQGARHYLFRAQRRRPPAP